MKLDENLSRHLVQFLAARGHDVTTVVGEGLGGENDSLVARAAAGEGRMIITLDRRFADIRRYPPGTHPGFLVLRPDDQSPPTVQALMEEFLGQYQLERLAGCLVVVEPDRVRVRRP